MSAPRSGLGKGLAALIPSAETAAHADLSGEEQLLHNLASSGLDQLDEHAKPELLAYVHQPRGGEPMLFLRKPAFETLSAAKAYRLFGRFEQAVRGGAEEGTFSFDDTVVVFIRTSGPHSAGVHFVGRTDGILDQRQVALVRASARSFGVICNQFASGSPDDLPTPRIVVELDGNQTAVTVSIDSTSGESLEARATAGDAGEAVARAVLAATGSALQFREARETPINGSRAVLVVYTDAKGMPKPGFLVSDDDLIQATAIASLRAIYGR